LLWCGHPQKDARKDAGGVEYCPACSYAILKDVEGNTTRVRE
jgi:hypothetical protein